MPLEPMFWLLAVKLPEPSFSQTLLGVCRQRKWDKMARCLRDTWGRCWSG